MSTDYEVLRDMMKRLDDKIDRLKEMSQTHDPVLTRLEQLIKPLTTTE